MQNAYKTSAEKLKIDVFEDVYGGILLRWILRKDDVDWVQLAQFRVQ
jgi:hypothetical protein